MVHKSSLPSIAIVIIIIINNVRAQCRTPDGSTGNCIPISTCDPIYDIIEDTATPIASEISAYLRRFQCGFSREVRVCCPKGAITHPAIVYRPRPVRGHRNLKLLPVDTCGSTNDEDKIINGDKTGVFEFPWMALLSYYSPAKGLQFSCGGTVINKRYILTAAHCLTNLDDLVLIGVRVGEHDIDKPRDCETYENRQECASPVQDRRVEKVVIHEKYNSATYRNDIGLVRLAQDLDLSVNSVTPICLPIYETLQTINLEGRSGLVTGWGITETGTSSSDLRKAALPIMRHEDCKNTYRRSANITHRQLCAGGRNNIDSCKGDSGGPLQIVDTYDRNGLRYIQIGVVSFGPKLCGSEGLPGVYTKIAYFMSWILDNLEP